MRYVSITTYAKMCNISREAVYKRIKKGTAILLHDSEVPVIDTFKSKGKMERNNLMEMLEPDDTPDWLYD